MPGGAAGGGVAPQRLKPRRRCGAPPPWPGCQALLPVAPPIPLQGALQRSALRKVGRPPRASAGAASAWLRGAPIPELCPRPPPRRHRPRTPAANPARLAFAAGGAGAPVRPPGGAQEAEHPSPARRNESLAAWRAPAVKAALAVLGATRP